MKVLTNKHRMIRTTVNIVNMSICQYSRIRSANKENSDFRAVTIEASTRGVLQKELFLKILQYAQENTCFGVSSQEY